VKDDRGGHPGSGKVEAKEPNKINRLTSGASARERSNAGQHQGGRHREKTEVNQAMSLLRLAWWGRGGEGKDRLMWTG